MRDRAAVHAAVRVVAWTTAAAAAAAATGVFGPGRAVAAGLVVAATAEVGRWLRGLLGYWTGTAALSCVCGLVLAAVRAAGGAPAPVASASLATGLLLPWLVLLLFAPAAWVVRRAWGAGCSRVRARRGAN